MKPWGRTIVAAAAAVTIIGAGLGTSTANELASPQPHHGIEAEATQDQRPSPRDEELISQLNAVATDLMDALHLESGFSSLNLDFHSASVVLRWKGDLPRVARDAVSEVQRTTGARIEHVSAEFSRDELLAARDQLSQELIALGAPYSVIEPTLDRSGLRVTLPGTPELTTLSVDDVEPLLDSVVPVASLEFGPAELPEFEDITFGRRNNDTGSLEGGARIHIANNLCGAGMSATRLVNDTRVMSTASHCFDNTGGADVFAPNGSWRGTRVAFSPARDIALFSGYDTYASWVWTGPWNTNTRRANGITQWAFIDSGPSSGNLCLTGASQGSVCSVRIVANEINFTFGGRTYVDLFRAQRFGEGGAGGGGDSGSPLIRWVSTNNHPSGFVGRPLGLVVGPLDFVPGNHTNCRGTATICNANVYYSTLRAAEFSMGFRSVGVAHD